MRLLVAHGLHVVGVDPLHFTHRFLVRAAVERLMRVGRAVVARGVDVDAVWTQVVARLAVVLLLVLIGQFLQLPTIALAGLSLTLPVGVTNTIMGSILVIYFLFALLIRYYYVVLIGSTTLVDAL